MLFNGSYVETSITVNESVVSEIVVHVQELKNNDSQNSSGELKSQLENEEIKPLHEDVELNSSNPNNQVSEVSTVLGFPVKSDSISRDCVSINEKNELKDNIIVDNVKLEVDVKPEMVQSSTSNVLPDGGILHPVDVEEPHENKVPVEETEGNKAANAEMSKNNDSADVFSEKLNSDQSSGDDSMEDDALENKQIDSKYNLDEVEDISAKTEVPVVMEEAPADVMLDDVPSDKKDIQDKNKNAAAAPIVKRKPRVFFRGRSHIETRNAVYNLQWPPNGGQLLMAEFVDPQEVKMMAEAPHSLATPVSTGPNMAPASPT